MVLISHVFMTRFLSQTQCNHRGTNYVNYIESIRYSLLHQLRVYSVLRERWHRYFLQLLFARLLIGNLLCSPTRVLLPPLKCEISQNSCARLVFNPLKKAFLPFARISSHEADECYELASTLACGVCVFCLVSCLCSGILIRNISRSERV
jgi:hypothetical protein